MLAVLLILSTVDANPTMTLWHAWRGAERRALEATLADLAPQVRAVAMPFDGFSEKLSAALSHRQGPDLFVYPHDRLGQWLAEGALFALDTPKTSLQSEALAALRADDRLYGLPLATKAYVLYGRRGSEPLPIDLLPPKQRLRPLIAASLNSYYEAFPWLAAQPFDDRGKPALNSAAHRLGLNRLKALIEASVLSKGLDAAQARAAFLRGQVPYLVDGPWAFAELSEKVEDLTIQALPMVGGKRARPFATVEAVFVSAHSPVARAAARVATALVSDASALRRATLAKQVVPNVTIWPELSAKAPELGALAAAQRGAIPLPTTPAMRGLWGPAKDAITAVLRQGRPATEALAQASARLAHLLAPLPPPAAALPWIVVICLLSFGALLVVWRRARAFQPAADLPDKRTLALFLGPGIAALTLLVATPILTGVVMSFFAHEQAAWHLVGWANYISIVQADGLGITHPLSFWFTLFITVVWTALNVALHVALGVGLALVLHQPGLRFSRFFRVLLILPWAIPNYVTALAWRGLFDQQIGAVNALITAFGGSGLAWWDSALTAFAANLTTNVWLGFPFMMVVALGALAGLPEDQIEAARIDGAGALMRLRFVILPQLLPAMIPAMLLGTIWTFNAFNVIYLVSGGDPAHSTDILVSEAYRWAFEGQGRYGYAAAYSVLIFGLLLLFALLSAPKKAAR